MGDMRVLTLLGRVGRFATVQALATEPSQSWNLHSLARAAELDPVTVRRAVSELAALGVVECVRPGRDLHITLRKQSPLWPWLAALQPPSVEQLTTRACAGISRSLRLWRSPDDAPGDPKQAVRIAVLDRDQERGLDTAGACLDACRNAGLPAPDVSVWNPEELGDDAISGAIRSGLDVQSLKHVGR